MSTGPLNFLIALALLFGLWNWSIRGRECADRISMRLCDELSVQRLDGSIALCGIRMVLNGKWPRVLRIYRFEFSAYGDDRLDGTISLIGVNAQWAHMCHPDGDIRIDLSSNYRQS